MVLIKLTAAPKNWKLRFFQVKQKQKYKHKQKTVI